MNHMTLDGPDAPWNEDDGKRLYCDCCNRLLSPGEAEDPCEIDNRIFCDYCASDLIQLRIDGYIKEVSARTRPLVITDDIFETLAKILKPNENK